MKVSADSTTSQHDAEIMKLIGINERITSLCRFSSDKVEHRQIIFSFKSVPGVKRLACGPGKKCNWIPIAQLLKLCVKQCRCRSLKKNLSPPSSERTKSVARRIPITLSWARLIRTPVILDRAEHSPLHVMYIEVNTEIITTIIRQKNNKARSTGCSLDFDLAGRNWRRMANFQ